MSGENESSNFSFSPPRYASTKYDEGFIQAITGMYEFEDKSFEELRLQSYTCRWRYTPTMYNEGFSIFDGSNDISQNIDKFDDIMSQNIETFDGSNDISQNIETNDDVIIVTAKEQKKAFKAWKKAKAKTRMQEVPKGATNTNTGKRKRDDNTTNNITTNTTDNNNDNNTKKVNFNHYSVAKSHGASMRDLRGSEPGKAANRNVPNGGGILKTTIVTTADAAAGAGASKKKKTGGKNKNKGCNNYSKKNGVGGGGRN